MQEILDEEDPGPVGNPANGSRNTEKRSGSIKFTVAEELILASLFIGKRQLYLENCMKLVNGVSVQKILAENWADVLLKGCRKKLEPNQIIQKINQLERGMQANEAEKNIPLPSIFDRVADKTFRCNICEEERISPGFLCDHVR